MSITIYKDGSDSKILYAGIFRLRDDYPEYEAQVKKITIEPNTMCIISKISFGTPKGRVIFGPTTITDAEIGLENEIRYIHVYHLDTLFVPTPGTGIIAYNSYNRTGTRTYINTDTTDIPKNFWSMTVDYDVIAIFYNNTLYNSKTEDATVIFGPLGVDDMNQMSLMENFKAIKIVRAKSVISHPKPKWVNEVILNKPPPLPPTTVQSTKIIKPVIIQEAPKKSINYLILLQFIILIVIAIIVTKNNLKVVGQGEKRHTPWKIIV